jgi:hypothetical protein
MFEQNAVLDSLREDLSQMWMIDTHEHLTDEDSWLAETNGSCDFSHFFAHYASVDVISAGCPQDDWAKIRSEKTPLDEKWELFEPYWEKAKYTAYCRAVRIAIRDLFDLPDLTRETYTELSRKLEQSRYPGWYGNVLKDRALIERSILNTDNLTPDPEFFVPVIHIDEFIMASKLDDLIRCEKRSGVSIHSLDDLIEAMDRVFATGLANGAVATKCALAYARTLKFDYPTKADAEKAFSNLFARNVSHIDHENPIPSLKEAKPLQDYLMHRLLQSTFDAGLPVQIHTGIQEGNGNYLEHSNPLHLNNLFVFYRSGRFDLFHAGYPFTRELGVMAKMFPGVHADLCWMHVISPSATRRTLDEWIDTVPASKIFGFGGDYIFVEGVYAHAILARENVARVLAGKISDGHLTESEARTVAQMILHDNAKEFFGV